MQVDLTSRPSTGHCSWLRTQGIDDALIQSYSGHATRQSLEIHSRLALALAQQRYDVIGSFPA